MAGTHQNQHAAQLLPFFERCGYSSTHVLPNVNVGENREVIAGFAQRPFDSRSACVVAMDIAANPLDDARACRNIGAPITFLCDETVLLWWSQTADEPYQVGAPVEWKQLEGFFREHLDDFAPATVYRAKTLGRFEQTYQKSFVDLGLMPVLEKETGEAIERLLLNSVGYVRDVMRWPRQVGLKQAQWLVKSVFWLLGAKMLHDKGAERFIRLNFDDIDEVFSRLVTHYGESADGLIGNQQNRRALEGVAQQIASSPSLQFATTEALAYVYENTLISKEIRTEFGTHSTPSYLVDYIVGRLEPWIKGIDRTARSVFEPACGHAAFLVSAIRLLTSLLPPALAEPAARKKYLRDRIRGYDVDDFAIEIARLSLTLTDIPNPNGWSIRVADLFESDLLERTAKDSMILLANTPFEDLRPTQRAAYARKFRQPQYLNKTSEMLYRALSSMPTGAVFGVVIPQVLLHEANASNLRQLIVNHFEIDELCLFPDKVFNFADQESAVVIGRKHPPSSSVSVRYRRVREREMALFRESYNVTSEVLVQHARFQKAPLFDLRVPDLESVWAHCNSLPELSQIAQVGQGFSHIGEDRPSFPKGSITVSDVRFEGGVEGFPNLGHGVQTHQLPPLKWLNLSPDVVRRAISGTEQGVPQILLNESPIQRAPWCLRAMIDVAGRPAKSSFTIIRPTSNDVSLLFLWALLNSPIANAYAYAHSSKRNILSGTWRTFKVPHFDADDVQRVNVAVKNYFDSIVIHESVFPLRSASDREQERVTLRDLHWRIDSEILRLYQLPVQVERQLLDYFDGWERQGVPFTQDCYFPKHFEEPLSLQEFLAITQDWERTNLRREELLNQKHNQSLSPKEIDELRHLQRLAGLKRELLSSPPIDELLELRADLKRRNLWQGQ